MRLPRVRVLRSVVLVTLLLACSGEGTTAPALRTAPASPSNDASSATTLLVITEVMSDPTKVADGAGEWFEVYNAGSATIDLMGWKILSGVTATPESHTIASSVVIPPGGYAVLGNNANAFTNGGVTVNYAWTPGTAIQLNNSNTDWLALKTPDGTLMDSVAYSVRTSGNTIGTPAFTPVAGASRVFVVPDGKDIADENSILANGVSTIAHWETTPTGTTYGLGDRGTPGSGPYRPTGIPIGEVAAVTLTINGTVTVGGTKQLSAEGRDALGFHATTTFTWQSSNESITTVEASGLAHGIAEGTATITATAANGVAGTATLQVVLPIPASVTFTTNAPHQVPVGYVKPAFPTVRDASGGIISPPPPLTWESSNTDVATIDGNGYITGVGAGTTDITVRTNNGLFKTLSFDVIDADAPTTAVYRNHLELGEPADADPSDDILLPHKQYVVDYNPRRGGPNWVSWELNSTQFGPVDRCDCFSPDVTLRTGVYRVVDFDYRNGGYDRGHMAQSFERSTTDQENASTFILTNILPQAAENNQGPWAQFEKYLNDLAMQQRKEIYIIAGGIYGPTPATLKGEGKVPIPDYTWKVAVILNEGEGLSQLSLSNGDVIAVKMPNLVTAGVPASAVGIRNQPWQDFATTVDDIEAATGYDLLNHVSDAIQRAIEADGHAPVAHLSGPTSGFEGTPVQFSGALSRDDDVGDVLSYLWDFGDGTTDIGATPVHAFLDNGTYTVRLTVADRYGVSRSATSTVTVSNLAPVVQLTPMAGLTAVSGIPFSVTGTFTDAGVVDAPWAYTFSWSGTATEGGTSVMSPITATHTFTRTGM